MSFWETRRWYIQNAIVSRFESFLVLNLQFHSGLPWNFFTGVLLEGTGTIVHICRKHLQEIPDQSSNVTTSFTWGWDSSKTSELLSGMGVSALEKEEVDSENIPQELLSNLSHPQSPPRKRLKSKGNDKDFVIVRRSKLNRENFPGKV